MLMRKNKVKELSIDLIFFLIGSLAYALSSVIFVEPNNMVPGGILGLALMLFDNNKSILLGTWIVILNIPLILWAIFEFRKSWKGLVEFLGKSLCGLLISSLFTNILQMIQKNVNFLTYKVITENSDGTFTITGDMLVVTIFGAVLSGIGMGMIFLRGGNTAGTDYIAKLLKRHFKHLSLGKLLLIADGIVVTLGGIVYKNVPMIVYNAIFILINSKVIDLVILAGDKGVGRMMLIISEKSLEISKIVNEKINRSSTAFKSMGCYSGKEGEAIVCAVRANEVNKVYDIIKEVDPKAFIMVSCNSCEMIGNGFKSLHSIE